MEEVLYFVRAFVPTVDEVIDEEKQTFGFVDVPKSTPTPLDPSSLPKITLKAGDVIQVRHKKNYSPITTVVNYCCFFVAFVLSMKIESL